MRLALLALWLTGCSLLSPPASSPALLPTTTAAPTEAAPTLPPPAVATPTPTGPQTLRLWLPPRFARQEDSETDDLLWARLQAWQEAHPQIRLDVRIKAEEGPANILDALQKTAAAAPANLPDLVILQRSDLEAAAALGILHPLDGLTLTLDDPNWFPVAQELGMIQNTQAGLPLALDALVIVYRQDAFTEPPQSWQDFSAAGVPVLFPAQDPRARLPFLLYRAYGGLLHVDGQPALDEPALSTTLTFFAEGARTGWFSARAADFSSYEAVWDEYRNGRQRAVVTWLSAYLQDKPAQSQVMPIPGAEGAPIALVDGWVLALAGESADQQAAAIRLAEYLTEGAFLADWTQAVGLLPPRPLSASAWSTDLIPADTLVTLGRVGLRPPAQNEQDALASRLQQAVLDALTGGLSP